MNYCVPYKVANVLTMIPHTLTVSAESPEAALALAQAKAAEIAARYPGRKPEDVTFLVAKPVNPLPRIVRPTTVSMDGP